MNCCDWEFEEDILRTFRMIRPFSKTKLIKKIENFAAFHKIFDKRLQQNNHKSKCGPRIKFQMVSPI